MTLIDVDSIQEPLQIDNFTVIPENKYPYSIIGFQLKNLYDQQRIRIKSKYNTKDIIHILPTANLEAAFFRGIKIHIREKYFPLIEQLKKLNVTLTEAIDISVYKNLLEEYHLSCNDSYAFLKKGIYPIDGHCLSKISNIDITLESLYENAFNTKKVPAFQSFCYFTIFILCNNTIFTNHKTPIN
jgi:hypothetical protein